MFGLDGGYSGVTTAYDSASVTSDEERLVAALTSSVLLLIMLFMGVPRPGRTPTRLAVGSRKVV